MSNGRLRKGPFFTLQWHLTAECDQHCQHCYVRDSETYQRELENQLSYEDCINIIDDFSETVERWGILGRINFSGGDPLLRNDFFDIMKYARERGLTIGILGNPNHLDYETAKRLKGLGLCSYQVSIDGLEETHDKLRGRKGVFKDTLRAIHLLEEVGIPSVVMFTLSKKNAYELIDVIRLVAKEGVSIFDFARLVPTGAGKKLKGQMLEPSEYRNLLLEVLEEYKRLKDNGCKTHFGRKDHLWRLLLQELGLFNPLPEDKETIYGGCGVGINLLTILTDGTVYSCRRLPIEIGKVPEQSVRYIFIESKKQNELRDVSNFEKCSRCDLLQFCRGCPAVSYAANGSYFAEDPQCWKEV